MLPADNNFDPFGLRRTAEAARRGPNHIKFLFIFVGVGIVMSFLVLASLAPQVGDRLGNLAVRKQAQQSLAASGDTDGDGFINEVENYIGTDPYKSCGTNAWPPDFNNDRKVTNSDVLSFRPSFGSNVGDARYDKRHDLNANGSVNIQDVGMLSPYFNKSCSTIIPKPSPSPLPLPVSNLQVTSSCNSGNLIVSFHWQNNILSTNYRYLDINVNPWINEDQPQPWGTKFQLGDSFNWNKDMPLDQGDVDPKAVGNQLRPAENMTYYWRILAGNENIKYPPVYPLGTNTPPGVPFTTTSCSSSK